MASTLAQQLQYIAENSVNTVSAEKQKAIYSISLLYPPSQAATQDIDTIYGIAIEGFNELIEFDPRIARFERGIFSEASRSIDRFVQTREENEKLDKNIEEFLGLVGPRVLLKGALKALEWLVRKFRIHEQNTASFILTFLPYHTHPIFARVISIIPRKSLPIALSFLTPHLKPASCPPRDTITKSLTAHPDFFNLLTGHVLVVVSRNQTHHALISFYITVTVEALNRMCSTPTYRKRPEDIILKVMPILIQGLQAKHAPEFQIGCYMIITVLVAKLPLDDKLLDSLIAEVVDGWSKRSISPGLACIALMAQERKSWSSLPSQAVKGLVKVEALGQMLVDMGEKYRVDGLAASLSLGILENLGKYRLKGIKLVERTILDVDMLPARKREVLTKLLETAIKGDITDEDVRVEVANFLVAVGEGITGEQHLAHILQTLLNSEGIDVETLELRLQTVIRPAPAAIEAPAETKTPEKTPKKSSQVEFTSLLSNLPQSTTGVSFLSPESFTLFESLVPIFLRATNSTSRQEMEELFKYSLFSQSPANDAFTLSFLVKIWTSKKIPALARAAALAQAQRIISATPGDIRVDYQALLPYILVALADFNRKVRAEASNLLVSLFSNLKQVEASRKKDKSIKTKIWGFDTIFDRKTEEAKWMETSDARKLIEGLGIIKVLEEAILDRDVVKRVVSQGLGKDGEGLKSSLKATAMSFLSSHIMGNSDVVIKLELLTLINAITSGAAAKAKPTVQLIENWANVPDYAVFWGEKCTKEKVDIKDMEMDVVRTVGEGDKGEGVELLISIIQGKFGISFKEIGGMRIAACQRIRDIWDTIKDEVKTVAARGLLDVALSGNDEADTSGEAMGVLKHVSIPREVFEDWLQQCLSDLKSWTAKLGHGPTGAGATETQPSNKRKKTEAKSTGDTVIKDTEVVGPNIDRLTAVLELLEVQPVGEKDVSLLKLGFGILSEVMNVTGEIGIGVGYLLQLILGILSGIVNYIKTSKDPNRKLDGSIRADVLVNCIRSTTSPQVQNRALLLVAALADVAPEVVLHSVMPIFTFMGANVLRQDDEYSAHVIEQTVERVIPPLVKSLQQQFANPLHVGLVGGVAELVSSFVTAYEHIPAHRRLRLFVKLTDTLGEEDFLFIVIVMLVEKYFHPKNTSRTDGKEESIVSFCREVVGAFGEETQLISAVKYLDMVIDILHTPLQGISKSIFSTIKDAPLEFRTLTASKLLQMLASVFDNEKLRVQIGRRLNQGDMDAERLRSHFSNSLEKVLALGKDYPEGPLRTAVDTMMEKLLDLLSTPEFVKVVETLITNSTLFRRSALAMFRDRVESEFRSDSASKTAILGLMPKIASIITSPDSATEFKGDALSCINVVTSKHGRRDPSIIFSITDTVIGPGGLRSDDEGLRVLALVCLTDMTTCLAGRFVPIVPKTVPFALELLEESIHGKSNGLVHNAVFAFLESLVNTIPSFMSSYLQKMLKGAWTSTASAEMDESDTESETESVAGNRGVTQTLRTGLLETIAKKMDFKVVMTAMSATWDDALQMGYSATTEHLTTLSSLLLAATKGQVQKDHPLLGSFFLLAFELRRQVQEKKENVNIRENELAEIETSCFKTALQMVLKLNDMIFKPMFLKFSEWAAEDLNDSDGIAEAKFQRTITFYNFLSMLSDNLKSLITEYYSFILPNILTLLNTLLPPSSTSSAPGPANALEAYTSVLTALSTSFTTDDREFWTSPMYFSQISTPLLSQLIFSPLSPSLPSLISTTIVSLASACSGSDDQLKTINTAVLKHLRSENAEARMAAVKTEMGLYRKLGEEWLGMLPETVPYIAELLEDDVEEIERETQLWIKLVEGYLGEGELEAMLS